jgi:hypothetical protein|nr:MAG TPA: zinc-ribbon domain protein [Caudoviricetes sp.]
MGRIRARVRKISFGSANKQNKKGKKRCPSCGKFM